MTGTEPTPRSVLYSLTDAERDYVERLTRLPFEHFALAYLRASGERVNLDELEPARARRVLLLAAETLRRGFNPCVNPEDGSHPVFVAEASTTTCSDEDEPASWPAEVLQHAIMTELRAMRALTRREQRSRKREREQGAT